VSVIVGDCVEVMAGMEPESVDAIVTDPPYGLEFMGKEWDRLLRSADRPGVDERFRGRTQIEAYRGGQPAQEWHERWANAALRVAKPGAYLLAFGGTRTFHRLACAIENAGWIIRDTLVWAYAQGFPKSRASLKPAWEPILLARKPGPLRALAIDECRIGTDAIEAHGGGHMGQRIYGNGQGVPPIERGANAHAGRWPANVILTDPIFDGGWEGVVGGGESRDWGVPPDFEYNTPDTGNPRIYGNGSGVPKMRRREGGYGDTGTYSRFFALPRLTDDEPLGDGLPPDAPRFYVVAKASRSDREPLVAGELENPYCDCETVKLGAWESEVPRQPVRTASTLPGRATSEALWTADNGSATSSNGSGTSEPSHPDTRSTTSTATSRTTASATSSSSIASPTSDSTPDASSSTASGGSDAQSAGSSDRSTPSGGTSHPKAGRSTDAAAPAISAASSRQSACERCGRPRHDDPIAFGNRVCRNCGHGQFDGRRDGPCCDSPDYAPGQVGRGGGARRGARLNAHPT
jgi:site-specific DNA-methyltransferase (adenine-specific)